MACKKKTLETQLTAIQNSGILTLYRSVYIKLRSVFVPTERPPSLNEPQNIKIAITQKSMPVHGSREKCWRWSRLSPLILLKGET